MIELKDDNKIKAKKIIRTIIDKMNGRFTGRINLCNIFYYAHLFHWTNQEGILSNYPIIHMPYGPSIYECDILLDELKNDKIIEIDSEQIGPYREDVYILGNDKELYFDLRDEKKILSIQQAIDFYTIGNMQLKKNMEIKNRSWYLTKDSEEMSIYLDTLSDYDYQTIEKSHEKIASKLNELFKEI